MTAYNRRFGKAPRHDFDVHRPLETDDDLTAFFTWREPRRVSKSLTVQYDKVLYLIEDNELSRRAIGKYIEVWHYPDGRKELRLNNPEKIIGFGGLGIRNYDDIVINNLGYRLSTEAWGKGLATEFAIYAIKFGFDVIKLTEISAVVRENHLASQKVLQKSGLRYVKEIHDVKDAPPSLLYSISVDEWLRNLEVNASV
ncbi:GNAT family N-acetyltransferase [Klebsiella pneumoniae]|nr:GNAT family N-acetyltransferase [Klebsiella pneumoniae]MBM0181463.1 GNAT family N-acetyltransferase [Klebsiella pneumoniae]MBM0186431.1 GNAT family N-acetyltransferase [Klebsiella pneumoniae]